MVDGWSSIAQMWFSCSATWLSQCVIFGAELLQIVCATVVWHLAQLFSWESYPCTMSVHSSNLVQRCRQPGVACVWFSVGSVVAQLWFRLVLHDALYDVALVQPWTRLVCLDVSCGWGLVVMCVSWVDKVQLWCRFSYDYILELVLAKIGLSL